MLTITDNARTAYELHRAAANDDRPARLIRADVTLNLGDCIHRFPAIGFSRKAIEKSAEELAGNNPFGVTVMVPA